MISRSTSLSQRRPSLGSTTATTRRPIQTSLPVNKKNGGEGQGGGGSQGGDISGGGYGSKD